MRSRCSRNGHRAILLAMALAAFPLSAPGAQLFVDPQFGVSVTSNVQYATGEIGNGTQKALKLDVYRPTGANLPTKLPAIVLMHGGFFVDGDKSSMSGIANQFAQRGYVAVSINYRKLPDLPPAPGAPLDLSGARFPSWLPGELKNWGVTLEQYADTVAAAVSDQAAAVNWLAKNAGTYSIDPGMIAAGGYSAGAVSSLALGAGVIDGASADVGAVFSMAGALFGLESAYDAGDPGVFLLHSNNDTTVPSSEIPYLLGALSNAGVPHESLIVPGAGHSSGLMWNAVMANPDPFFEFMIGQLVPEPATWQLLGMATLGLFLAWRRGRRF